MVATRRTECDVGVERDTSVRRIAWCPCDHTPEANEDAHESTLDVDDLWMLRDGPSKQKRRALKRGRRSAC